MLSTAQQVWLRKMGGAKPLVDENAGGIISAGRAKRSGSQPEKAGERLFQRAKSFCYFCFLWVLSLTLFLKQI